MTQARQDGITLKQWLPLIGLTCCAFVFNTSEFMPIGLLTDIAASFSLTESQAGIMISVYAWGVMLLSLPLMVFASRFEFKRMLLGVLAVFSLGQFLSAVAPTYPILVCARLVVACAHAVFWSVASIMASRLVDTRHGALAISMIATGSSIAQIFGLPLGRAIGLAVGWRMTFAVVGVLSAIAVVYQATVFPAMPAGERFTVKQLPELLKNPLLIALYAVTVFMATGYYAGYSYIEPFLAQVAHVDAGAITMTLTAFGCLWLLQPRRSCWCLPSARYGAAAPRPSMWRSRLSSSSTRRRIRRPLPCRSSRACSIWVSARARRLVAPWCRAPVSPGSASWAGRSPS